MLKTVWECSACGVTERKWVGCCQTCGSWNSFVEKVKSATAKALSSSSKAISLAEVENISFSRNHTNIKEFDRLVGGGIVVGSVILISGSPGIGKSTLLLQLAQKFAMQSKALYICAEESEGQTSLRAKRLQIKEKELFLFHSGSIADIKQQIEDVKPSFVIMDSVQMLHHPEISSPPGSIAQVKECVHQLTALAKRENITLFLVSHVTKSGDIAGPKLLEHIVDVVLEFEGDKQHGFRVLRSSKNRFGPTDEVALFEMREEGLQEVNNPSEFFLHERAGNSLGCVTVCVKEGGRFFLIEIQALVTSSVFSSPTRRSAGLDQNRLALLLAVLEKKVGYSLHNCDVFVSVTGGLKVQEPAIDLGVLLAIASSFCSKIIDPKMLFIGEVGLAGEIRSTPNVDKRLKEAMQMGFTSAIVPKRSSSSLSSIGKKMQIYALDYVEEAIDKLF